MSRGAAGNWKIVLALLLGVAIAFPAGMYFAGSEQAAPPPAAEPASSGTRTRNLYSPAILSDPAFRTQQRELVETLESHCHKTGQNCAEAAQARRWFDRNEADAARR